MAKIRVIDVDGSQNEKTGSISEGRKLMEYVRKQQKANQDVADAVIQNFTACYHKETAAGRHSVDFKPNRRNSPMPTCGGLPLYHSLSSMFADHEETYDRARDEILPLIQKKLSTMGFDHYRVTLRKFNPTKKPFCAYLGFRIQAGSSR